MDLFPGATLEQRITAEHPLCAVRALTDMALEVSLLQSLGDSWDTVSER